MPCRCIVNEVYPRKRSREPGMVQDSANHCLPVPIWACRRLAPHVELSTYHLDEMRCKTRPPISPRDTWWALWFVVTDCNRAWILIILLKNSKALAVEIPVRRPPPEAEGWTNFVSPEGVVRDQSWQSWLYVFTYYGYTLPVVVLVTSVKERR